MVLLMIVRGWLRVRITDELTLRIGEDDRHGSELVGCAMACAARQTNNGR